MVDHAWVQENLDTYLAGELTTAERDKVERHAAICEACRQGLAEARRLEQVMNGLFRDARPDANLEERLVQSLRAEPVRKAQRPMFWRVAVAAAAVLVIGLIGGVVQGLSGDGSLFAENDRTEAKQRSKLVTMFDSSGSMQRKSPRESVVNESPMKKQALGTDWDPAAEGVYKDKLDELRKLESVPVDYQKELSFDKRVQDVSVPGAVDANKTVGIRDGDKTNAPLGLPAPGGFDKGQGGGLETISKAKNLDGREKKKEDLHIQMPPVREPMALQDPFKFRVELKKDDMKDAEEGRYYADKGKDKLPGMDDNLSKVLKELGQKKESPLNDSKGPKATTEGPLAMLKTSEEDGLKSKLFDLAVPMPVPTTGPDYFVPAAPGLVPPPSIPPGDVKPGDGNKGEKDKGGEGKEGGDKGPGQEKVPQVEAKPEPKSEPKPLPKKLPTPPLETNRKIIRTGEMDFEVVSFDKAVKAITNLVIGEEKDGKIVRDAIPGAFIGTINSDQLPNGKVRGSIVVRMPPQHLDKFVDDMRTKLASMQAEMKTQRIISLDVTKQYTDIESRLRAARAIEDRLIQIIKTGKGEIKDLILAEKELGNWRTKIEEMEGEIRYYANQVSLSTLTITVYEKEILAPTAVVITDSVRMRLEVDDVAKAHKTVMDAIEKIGGRLTKSELKQHVAGQLQSIIHAEIPPKDKIAFTLVLQKLGITSLHDENQGQYSEGGTGKGTKLQRREDDVHFEISMHNTANVRPRLTADLKIATTDVPAAYDRLLTEITSPKVKGQVRDAKLDERNKLNITASIDFNVPIEARPAIDKLLKDLGPELEKVNVRAPVSELSTDRKFGYTVVLRDFAAIPPAKAIIDIISTTNVPDSYAKLQAAIADAKGQIADANLNELNKLDIVAKIEFTIPTEKKAAFDTALEKIGTSMSSTNVQAPMSQLSTKSKFGYVLYLRDYNSIPASKASEMKIAVNDVPAAYAKLTEAILKAKGHTTDTKLNEQEKLSINAHIAFSVPIAEKAGLDKLLLELGDVLSRNNVQAPANQLASDKKFGYAVDLRDFTTIPPSLVTTQTVAASNVPENYDKLMKAILKAKGQVADAKLNEKDKLNVMGVIAFTVLSAEKRDIDDLLKGMGTILSKDNVQAPGNILSTDRKFGYVVELLDFASIPARETFSLQITLIDVNTTFSDLKNAVTEAKGWINLAQVDKDGNADFRFDVPADKKAAIEALLKKAGVVTTRTSSEVPVNTRSTDKKVGYQVTLRSSANIPPREKVSLKYEVADVDAKAAEFKQMLLAAKGRLVDSGIVRHENGTTTAILVIDVPFASQDALIRQMGKPVTQSTKRDKDIPENEMTTARLTVELTGATPIISPESGVESYMRRSLYLSFNILAFIGMSIIVGLSAIVPCALLIWIGVKLYAAAIGFGDGGSMTPTLAPAGGAKLSADDDKPGEPQSGEPTTKA